MTIKQVKALHNFIMIFQNHWSIYIVVYMLLVVAGNTRQVPLSQWFIWMGLGMIPLFLNKLRTACRYRVLRYSVYTAVLLGVYMLRVPHIAYTYIYLLCVAYYCVNTEWYDWSREDCSDYKPIPIVLVMLMSFVVILVFQWVRLFEYQRTILYLLIMNVMIYSLASYINKYVRFLDLNKHSIGYMPIKSVLGSGMMSMLGFSTILCSLLLIVASIGKMGDVLQYVKRFIEMIGTKVGKALREWIKKWLNTDKLKEVDLENTITQIPIPETEDKWTVLDIIFAVLLGIVALHLLYQVVRLIIYFLNAFIRVKGSGESIGLQEDVREKSDVVEKLQPKKKMGLLEAMTPAQRIRRRFKRKVLSEQKQIFSKDKRERMELYTAKECAEIMEVSEMSQIYEKARYSPYECTAEDVKNMKNVCKRHDN